MQDEPALSQAVEPLNVSVKGTDPKPKGFAGASWGSPGGSKFDILGRHSVFWELFLEHFRAAQRVLGRVFGTLGRHGLFWELFFEHCRAAQRALRSVFVAL